ncbi:MAG: ribonuclease HII [Dehalococcoidia bacterium]
MRGPLRIPTLEREHDLWRDGHGLVAGLDEVGRGPLAGPVVAAAVVLDPAKVFRNRYPAPEAEGTFDANSKPEMPAQGGRLLTTESYGWLDEVRDSKQLSARRRHLLAERIHGGAAVGIGVVPADMVDSIGIIGATRQAMRRALANLPVRPTQLLIDALLLPEENAPQTSIIHGDGLCVSIACASIVAKVARDWMMIGYDRRHPGYGFDHNKGYGTREHLDALRRLGPSAIHRRSFAPIAAAAVTTGGKS